MNQVQSIQQNGGNIPTDVEITQHQNKELKMDKSDSLHIYVLSHLLLPSQKRESNNY